MSACPLCNRPKPAEAEFCGRCDAAVDVDKVLGFLGDEPRRSTLPPRQIGRYRIVKPIGEGGAGVVYEAIDSSLGRTVALKVLKTAGLDRALLERFLREARVLARLEHPNIVRIFELGRDGGSDFLVMELVEGRPFPDTGELREGVRRLALIARALHHAHGRGVVHRDLKPSNVLVERSGRPVLMDFGIARASDAASSLTATGMVMGTPGYMAPEQFDGDPSRIDHRVDVWALGVMLYELLAGRRAYVGGTALQVAEAVRRALPPRPGEVRSGIPPALEAVWARAMAPAPENRYSRAKELAEDLERWLAGKAVQTAPVAVPPAPSASRRLLAGAAVLAVLLAGAALLRPFRRLPPSEPAPAPAAAVPGPLERARALLAGPAPADFAAAADVASKAEAELRRAVAEAPRSAAPLRELGRLLASRFRADAAHAAYDEALALEADADTVAAKGDLVLTSLLVYRIDRLRFPELVQGLAARLGLAHGPALDRLAARFPVAKAYAHAARSDFASARRALPADDPLLRLVLDYLDDERRAATLLALNRVADPGPGERAVWLPLIRTQEHKALAAASRAPLARTKPLHAGLIRLEAWAQDARGEDEAAAARLGDALLSAPEYLPARLARAKLLESLKDPVQAASELEIVRKQARAAGLGDAIR